MKYNNPKSYKWEEILKPNMVIKDNQGELHEVIGVLIDSRENCAMNRVMVSNATIFFDDIEEVYENVNEKENQIKYLEHQIFLYEKDIKNLSKDYKVYYSLIQEERHKLEVYQDILERLESGKYE